MNENKSIQQVQVAVPQMSKQDFLNGIVEVLGGYKWPKGAIECINPDNTKLVYLWGYRFKGSAEGTWTAKVSGKYKLTVNKQEVEIADGTPYSGPIPNVNFDLLLINDNQTTPYWAKEFCRIGFIGNNYQPYSSIANTGGTIEGDDSGNPLSAWMKDGNTIVDNFLLPIATDLSQNAALAYLSLNVLPAEIVQQSAELFKDMKFNSRDVAVTSRNSVSEDPTPVLIPFYVLEFRFEGATYHLAMMADASNLLKGKVPPVKEKGKDPQKIVEDEMPDKVKQANILKWGWVLAILLLLVVNLKIAFVYLIAWAIGLWFIKKPINDRIKELEQDDANDKQATAALLKKQLIRKS